MSQKVKISAVVNTPLSEAWEKYTKSEHIINWNFASPEWCCPTSTVDLREGGKFSHRMEAKDGSFGFDFGGTYTKVRENELLTYRLDDGRMVETQFTPTENSTLVETQFDPDAQNSVEMQRQGWQAILDNFKSYAETK